jgi:signal transduction histidine kinase
MTDLSTFDLTGEGDSLQDLLDLLWELLEVTCCLLWQFRAGGQVSIERASQGTVSTELLYPFFCQLIERHQTLLSQGKAVALPASALTGSPEEESDAPQLSFHCLLLVPLYYQQAYLGGICLYGCQPESSWTETELQKIRILAAQCAATLFQTQNLPAEPDNLTKPEFLSHITHELRTPLTGILGFSRMLRDEIYGSLNAKQKQYVSGIINSGEHLLDLVNDFLDLSKIHAQREELFLEKVAVADLCLAACSTVQPKAQEEGLELELEIGPEVDFCEVDQRRLKQILINLLSNAIKFTEVGSITLKVRRDGDMLEFAVIDTGIGISSENMQKLFQPFQQISNVLNRKYKGTGLGLTLSRQLARLHGGDLTVTSQEGKGSCFTLRVLVR